MIFLSKPHGTDEKHKSIVISGDGWEFNQSKRLLSNVVEVVLINMTKEMIIRKIGPLVSSFTSVTVLRMMRNHISLLREVNNDNCIDFKLLPLTIFYLSTHESTFVECRHLVRRTWIYLQ